jgi:hypothetical protein
LVFGGINTQSCTVKNTGSADLVVSISVSSSSFKVTSSKSFTVGPGKTHGVDVERIDSATHVAKMSIQSNASNNPDVQVTLQGLGATTGTLDQPHSHGGLPNSPSENPGGGGGTSAPASGSEFGGEIGGSCFMRDTLVLLADGNVRAIEALSVGDEIWTISEREHLKSSEPRPGRARIEAVLRHERQSALLDVGGVRATAPHRWAVRLTGGAGFVRTGALVSGQTYIRACQGDGSAWRAAPPIVGLSEIAPVVFNLTTSARTYAVAARAEGPFYLVHNEKDPTKQDTTGGSGNW